MGTKLWTGIGALLLASVLSAPTNAAQIDLVEWGINLDGALYGSAYGDPLSIVPGLDASGFDDSTGLGSLSMTLSGAGQHLFIGFFDHEIDEPVNTYFNEVGSASGTPQSNAAGVQSFEIDEPQSGFAPTSGDIYDHYADSSVTSGSLLDNDINRIPGGSVPSPEDVSMAIGWDFSLLPGERAIIDLMLSTTAPVGFYLAHDDPNSSGDATIYFSSALRILPASVSEPAIAALLGMGLIGGVVTRRRRHTRCGHRLSCVSAE